MRASSAVTPMSQDQAPSIADAPPAVSPAVHQRLSRMFERANKCFEKGEHAYADELLAECVSENPKHLAYVQHFRANLTKLVGEGKKASAIGGLLSKSGRGAIDKAAGKGEWQKAFATGCAALKRNPGDVGALQAMAAAAGSLPATDCQLYYLRWALDIDRMDLETNRQAAFALAQVKEFDQAIACWQRVLKQKPMDEEAAKMVAGLGVEKTIHVGGYKADVVKEDGAEDAVETAHVAHLAAKENDGSPREVGAEDNAASEDEVERLLLAKLEEEPNNSGASRELALWYAQRDRPAEAERVLRQAIALTPADGELLNALEDLHLSKARRQLDVARDRAVKADSPENRELLQRMVDQVNRVELEVYAARAKRSPGDTRLQFELGVRQKRRGEYRAAITSFQAARGDRQRLAETQVFLGECFHHIEQYRLAMSSYEAALAASEGQDSEVRKLALYRAGVLATGLKDYEKAGQRLTELAALDFGYRDVADRLDKLAAKGDSA